MVTDTQLEARCNELLHRYDQDQLCWALGIPRGSTSQRMVAAALILRTQLSTTQEELADAEDEIDGLECQVERLEAKLDDPNAD